MIKKQILSAVLAVVLLAAFWPVAALAAPAQPLVGITFSYSAASGRTAHAAVSPAFSGGVTTYTVMAPASVPSLKITPAKGAASYSYTIKVNRVAVAANKPYTLTLKAAETSVVVTVTAGATVVSYYFLVIRQSADTVGATITPSMSQLGSSFYYSGYRYRSRVKSLVKKTGTTVKYLSYDDPLWIQTVGSAVVYSNAKDNNYIYRINNDGTGRAKLASYDSYGLAVYNGFVYFSSGSPVGIYRVGLDGKNLKKLAAVDAHDLTPVNGWIYYVNGGDSDKIYRIRADGRGNAPVGNDSAVDLRASGTVLFFSNDSDSRSLYRINTSGTGRLKLRSGPSYTLEAASGWIYFGDGSNDSVLSAIKTDGTGVRTVSSSVRNTDSIHYAYGYLYIQTEDGKMYRIKPDGTGLVTGWKP